MIVQNLQILILEKLDQQSHRKKNNQTYDISSSKVDVTWKYDEVTETKKRNLFYWFVRKWMTCK